MNEKPEMTEDEENETCESMSEYFTERGYENVFIVTVKMKEGEEGAKVGVHSTIEDETIDVEQSLINLMTAVKESTQ